MAEYIEREALLSHQYNKSWSREPQFAEMVVDVENIYDAPAADVVEVVRAVLLFGARRGAVDLCPSRPIL